MKDSAEKLNLCSELVQVFRGPAVPGARGIVANLEEISESSLELNAEEAFAPGERVELHCKTSVLRGIVESDIADPVLGHFVKVRLDADSQWSEKWFTPQHLFALWKHMENLSEEPKQEQPA